MGSTDFEHFDIFQVLEEQDLTRVKFNTWYVICKANLGISEEGDPYQDLVLYFDPTSRAYVFRVFSRIHQKGNVNSLQEFQQLVYNCFGQVSPCLGVTAKLSDLHFTKSCLKFAQEGDTCVECKDPKNLPEKSVIKQEPGLPSDIKDEELDDIVSDFVETSMVDDDVNEVKPVLPEVNYNCTFCGKNYTNTTAYATHLLKTHNDETSVLFVWFDLPGPEKKKAMTLYTIRLGEYKPEIDWETNKTPEMEKLLMKHWDLLVRLHEKAKAKKAANGGDKEKPKKKKGGYIKKNLHNKQNFFTKTAEGQRECNLCSKLFNSRHTAASHLKLNHGFHRDYKCFTCNMKFEFPFPLACHMIEKHPEILPHQAKCVICQNFVTFDRDGANSFNEHVIGCFRAMDTQHRYLWRAQNPIPPCEFCNIEFPNHQKKKYHMVREHGEEPPFRCDECDHWTLFVGQMKRHKTVHMKKRGLLVGPNNESLYTACYICGKNISGNASSPNFLDHLKTHEEGEQQWPCQNPGCGQVFKSKSSLARHNIKAHSTDDKYLCKICHIRLPQPALRKHMSQVHGQGEMTYDCKLCGKKLKSQDGLTTHMRIHTGETPYSCDQCSYTCKSSSTLSAHKKHNHGTGLGIPGQPINPGLRPPSPLPQMRQEEMPILPPQPHLQTPEMAMAQRLLYPQGYKLPFYMGQHPQQ